MIPLVKRPTLPEDVLEFFRRTGAQGGKERARRHSKEQLREWGMKGGRPWGSGKKKRPKGDKSK